MTKGRLALAALAALVIAAQGCAGQDDEIGSEARAAQGGTLQIKSQLRGYDLGPPFPAGFRDSGMLNGYGEDEWIPFVAIMEGSKLEDSDELAGDVGDGLYGASIILPTYSPRNDANALNDLQVTGTYGQDFITPIPASFDDNWLVEHGYSPFVLGAFADDGSSDLAPVLGEDGQRSGPTRFGGDVASAWQPITFHAPVGATAVEVRFAVRMARSGLLKVAPDGQAFHGYEEGTSLGACSFHPGPGPLFVGYEVQKPTGIATVPIRCRKETCVDDSECPPGDHCDVSAGECEEPCVEDANCPTDQICEDGSCEEPPTPCVADEDCEGADTCVGGGCLPPCPEDGSSACGYDDVGCDAETCVPPGGGGGGGGDDSDGDGTPDGDDGDDDGDGNPDGSDQCPLDPDPCGPGGGGGEGECEEDVDTGECVPPGGGDGGKGEPPCIYDSQCEGGDLCEDGVCQPPPSPCDMSCPEGEECIGGSCQPPPTPCTEDTDCQGGETCFEGTCHPGEPPCVGAGCSSCVFDADCNGGEVCVEGSCHTAEPPVACTLDTECPDGQVCEGAFCDVPEPCTDDSQCPDGSVCDNTVDLCAPQHPPVPCDTVADCPAGDSCTSGFCQPPDQCNDDADCGEGSTCYNGGVDLCVPPHSPIPCDAATDCPSGDVCAGGFCAPDSPECKNSNQCPGQDVCSGGYCQPKQPACDSNLDCASRVCDGGHCIPPHEPVACENVSDCPSGDACAGGFCTRDSCEDDADCVGGTVCDNTVDLCVPPHPPIPCDGASDCPSGDLCEGDFCVPPEECVDDGDCGGGDVCWNGGVELCVPGQPPTPCTVDTECPADTCGYDDVGCEPVCHGGFCSPGGGGCSDDGDCPGGTTCAAGTCVEVLDPVQCINQYDCGAGYLCNSGVCEPGGDTHECNDATDCFGNDDVGNETCVGGVCYDNSVDLRICDSATICPAGTGCKEGFCQRIEGACELDGDCTDGKNCIAGWCDLACSPGGGCEGGLTCTLGRCVSSCSDYLDCSGGTDTCWSGGCVNRYIFVGDKGGDPELWEVALPGEGDVSGGCQASGGAGGGVALLLLGLLLGLRARGRRDRRN